MQCSESMDVNIFVCFDWMLASHSFGCIEVDALPSWVLISWSSEPNTQMQHEHLANDQGTTALVNTLGWEVVLTEVLHGCSDCTDIFVFVIQMQAERCSTITRLNSLSILLSRMPWKGCITTMDITYKTIRKCEKVLYDNSVLVVARLTCAFFQSKTATLVRTCGR